MRQGHGARHIEWGSRLQLHRCGETVDGTEWDARVGGAALGSGETTEMYQKLIDVSAHDRTNQLVKKDCQMCGRDYMTQIRVGESEVIVHTCKCGAIITGKTALKSKEVKGADESSIDEKTKLIAKIPGLTPDSPKAISVSAATPKAAVATPKAAAAATPKAAAAATPKAAVATSKAAAATPKAAAATPKAAAATPKAAVTSKAATTPKAAVTSKAATTPKAAVTSKAAATPRGSPSGDKGKQGTASDVPKITIRT